VLEGGGAEKVSRAQARCRVLAGEGGFTLIEMLVTASMLVLILTATLGLFTSSNRIGTSDLARDQALNDQTTAFSRMVNEIRQAYQINCPTGGCSNAATSTSIDFDERIYKSGAQADRRVAYNCGVAQPGVTGQYECVRYETDATDASDAVPLSASCSTCTSTIVIQNVVNTPVFSSLTTGTSGSGAVRWVSGQATIYTPANGALSSKVSPFKHDIILNQSFSMPQLQFGQ
jgi:type II secretory pathway pseudopilin PulG